MKRIKNLIITILKLKKNILIIALLIPVFTGCFPISSQRYEILSESRSDKEPTQRSWEKLVSARLNAEYAAEKQQLTATLTGTVDVKRWDEVEYVREINDKFMVVGFFPAMGASLYADEERDGLKSLNVVGYCLVMDIVLMTLIPADLAKDRPVFFFPVFTTFIGVPTYAVSTAVSWVTEPFAPWEPPNREGADLRFARYSIIGYSKSGDVFTGYTTKRENKEKTERTRYMRGYTIILEGISEDFLTEAVTGYGGVASFDLREISIDPQDPVEVRLRVEEPPVNVEPVYMTIPEGAFY